MPFKVTFPENVKEGGAFGPLPLGEYACRIALRIWQVDANGTPMTDGEGRPVPYRTASGDMLWYVDSTILDGPYKGKVIQDNWSFGKAIGRIWTVCKRLGIIPDSYKLGDPFNLNEEEIDQTFWKVVIDEHQVAERGGQITPANYPFKSACQCNICRAAVGKNVFVNAKVAFDGYSPMTKDEVKKYRAGAPTGGGGATNSVQGSSAGDVPFASWE